MLASRILLNQFLVIVLCVLGLGLPSESAKTNSPTTISHSATYLFKDSIHNLQKISSDVFISNQHEEHSPSNNHRDGNAEDEYLKNEKKESKENISLELEKITTFYGSLLAQLLTLEQADKRVVNFFTEATFSNFILRACFLFTNSSPPKNLL